METNWNIDCKRKIGNCKLTVTCKLETSQNKSPNYMPRNEVKRTDQAQRYQKNANQKVSDQSE